MTHDLLLFSPIPPFDVTAFCTSHSIYCVTFVIRPTQLRLINMFGNHTKRRPTIENLWSTMCVRTFSFIPILHIPLPLFLPNLSPEPPHHIMSNHSHGHVQGWHVTCRTHNRHDSYNSPKKKRDRKANDDNAETILANKKILFKITSLRFRPHFHTKSIHADALGKAYKVRY